MEIIKILENLDNCIELPANDIILNLIEKKSIVDIDLDHINTKFNNTFYRFEKEIIVSILELKVQYFDYFRTNDSLILFKDNDDYYYVCTVLYTEESSMYCRLFRCDQIDTIKKIL